LKIKGMKVNWMNDIELYRIGSEISEIGRRAINKVKDENKKLGVPLVYSRDGKIFYEMPDGTITNRSPFNENE
jgi:hypothetical protein